MTKKYFNSPSPETIQELKLQFRTYVKQFHPDVNKDIDTTATMIEVIAEYEELKLILPCIKTNDNTTQNMNKEEFDLHVSKEIQDILNSISHLPINIEVIGTWIWISGKTMPYKSYLTAFNFRWCSKKKMYSWHIGEYKKFKGKTKDIEDIRSTYGSTKVKNNFRPTLK